MLLVDGDTHQPQVGERLGRAAAAAAQPGDQRRDIGDALRAASPLPAAIPAFSRTQAK